MAAIDPSLDIVERLSLAADRSDMVRASLARTLLPEAAGIISALRQRLSRLNGLDRDELAECCDEELLLADGWDDAFLGITANHHHPVVAVYDYDRIVEIMVERDGMSHEDADEYAQFNIVGAYVGERTPIYVSATGVRSAGDRPPAGGDSAA